MATVTPTSNAKPDAARGAGVWMVVLGIGALGLGLIGIGIAPDLTRGEGLWFGVLFAVLGVGLILKTVFDTQRPRRGVHMLLGVLYLAGGLLMASQPLSAVIGATLLIATIAFTMLMGALLILLGVTRMVWAFGLSGLAKWLGVFGGVVSALLGAIILLQWPASGLRVIALFVAIDLILYGVTAIALALQLRKPIRAV